MERKNRIVRCMESNACRGAKHECGPVVAPPWGALAVQLNCIGAPRAGYRPLPSRSDIATVASATSASRRFWFIAVWRRSL